MKELWQRLLANSERLWNRLCEADPGVPDPASTAGRARQETLATASSAERDVSTAASDPEEGNRPDGARASEAASPNQEQASELTPAADPETPPETQCADTAQALGLAMSQAASALLELASQQQALSQSLATWPAAPTTDADWPSSVTELSQKVAVLAEQQDQLNRLYETRIHSDEVQAKALGRLHDELSDYKAGFVRQAILPILKDIIFCHDVIAKELARSTDDDPTVSEGENRTLALVAQMLLDILFKHDVEPYRCDATEFDRKLQHCVTTVSTDDPEQDRHVAEIGLTGFRSPEAILRREQVSVYRFKPAEAER